MNVSKEVQVHHIIYQIKNKDFVVLSVSMSLNKHPRYYFLRCKRKIKICLKLVNLKLEFSRVHTILK